MSRSKESRKSPSSELREGLEVSLRPRFTSRWDSDKIRLIDFCLTTTHPVRFWDEEKQNQYVYQSVGSGFILKGPGLLWYESIAVGVCRCPLNQIATAVTQVAFERPIWTDHDFV